jgi:ectoine hydroxylase-related dioxygenase (phytanoyl-CoA dioxygenase family)
MPSPCSSEGSAYRSACSSDYGGSLTHSVSVEAGDAIFFDRRIQHRSPTNWSPDTTRKVLFFGYSYRWLKPRDNMTVQTHTTCTALR